jgi:peptidoglycan hydrolase CwlO-like protein
MNKNLLTILIALTLPLSLMGSSRSKVRELTTTLQRIRNEHAQAHKDIQHLKEHLQNLTVERDNIVAEFTHLKQEYLSTRAICDTLEGQQRDRGQLFDANIATLIEVNRQLQDTEKAWTEMMSIPEKILLDEQFQGYIKETL